jgi:hypothetical protein
MQNLTGIFGCPFFMLGFLSQHKSVVFDFAMLNNQLLLKPSARSLEIRPHERPTTAAL